MTSHPVVSQRNRGTSPGRGRWRMALWEVLSISNPRRMPGQGNGVHCLLVDLCCWPTQLQIHSLALKSQTINMGWDFICSSFHTENTENSWDATHKDTKGFYLLCAVYDYKHRQTFWCYTQTKAVHTYKKAFDRRGTWCLVWVHDDEKEPKHQG